MVGRLPSRASTSSASVCAFSWTLSHAAVTTKPPRIALYQILHRPHVAQGNAATADEGKPKIVVTHFDTFLEGCRYE